jgi:hypothetical protein
VAERFPAPVVHKSIAVDRALLGHDDPLWRTMALSLLHTAKPHPANTLSVLRTVPGIGAILRLVLRDAIHASARCPRVQDCVSSCRLVTGAKASAGKRSGTSGTKIGHAYLQWAFSEAAVWFLRDHPAGQQYRTRLEKKHGKDKALTIVAPTWARAVYCMWKRHPAFAMDKVLHGSGSRAGEPDASLDRDGMRLHRVRCKVCARRRCTPRSAEAFCPAPDALRGPALWLRHTRRWLPTVHVCGPWPAPEPHGRTVSVQPPECGGRDEGTEMVLGRSRPRCTASAIVISTAREPQEVCGAATCGEHL